MAERRSDSELVARTLAGEQAAFGELAERYRDAVYGVAFHRLGRFEDARDAAQEAFVRAYASLAALRKPEAFANWLYRIAELTALQMVRRRKREAALPADEALADAADSLVAAQESDIAPPVREALATLSEPTRLAVILHYVNGYSHGEIAGFLGSTPGAVKTRVSRGRSQLRKGLGKTMGETLHEHAKELDFREAFTAGMAAAMRAFGPPTARMMSDSTPEWTETWVEKMQSHLAANPSDLCCWYLALDRTSFSGGLVCLSEASDARLERLAPILLALCTADRVSLAVRLAQGTAKARELAESASRDEAEIRADLAALEAAGIVEGGEHDECRLAGLGRAAVIALLQLAAMWEGLSRR